MSVEIIQGQYNEIHESVIIFGDGKLVLGDCNIIHEHVKIWVGGVVELGDYNTIHNHCFIGGGGVLEIRHNNWIGQGSVLDSTGKLILCDGCTVGYNSHLWSHICRGEQIEGYLCQTSETRLHDDVWLVGNNVHVSPGVTMAAKSAALAHSVVTRNTLPCCVYAGIPAKEIDVKLCREVPLVEKVAMMSKWCREFSSSNNCKLDITHDGCVIWDDNDVLEVGTEQKEIDGTHFDLVTKTYTKTLSELERAFIKFLYSNKARFTPR